MVERVACRAQAEGIANLDARMASVYDLPFKKGSLDAICMISVIGEIPVNCVAPGVTFSELTIPMYTESVKQVLFQ